MFQEDTKVENVREQSRVVGMLQEGIRVDIAQVGKLQEGKLQEDKLQEGIEVEIAQEMGRKSGEDLGLG